ncbi:MAG: helix-turn-helix domain-containing protein [Clostridia bacterium]|nr:helix-turn-helix domain-containing protein [Clostridia bacterium]
MENYVDIMLDSLPGKDHSHRFRYELYRDCMPNVFVDYNHGKVDSPTHFHSSIEILYVEDGQMQVNIDNMNYTVSQGQFIAVPSFTFHSCCVNADARRWVVVIPPELLGSTARQLDGKIFADCLQMDDGTIFSLTRIIRHAYSQQGIFQGDGNAENRRQIIRSLCAAIITAVISACGLREQNSPAPLIVNALKYIHLHFREDIRIPEMSHALLCTQQTLSSQFNAVIGMTISAYINHLRALDVRANLSDDPNMRLTEAAELAGFGSVRSMLRAYKREFGCTPSENR